MSETLMGALINGVLMFILIVVTGFYAWVTFRILKTNERVVEVMKRQNDALIRPYITVNTLIHPRHLSIYLKITNTGKTAAENVRLEIDKSFYQFGMEGEENNIANFPVFQKPIACLPPMTSLTFDLAHGPVIFGENTNPDKTPTKFSIRAMYSYAGEKVEEVTHIDLQPYLNSINEPNPLIEEFEGIRKAIENIGRIGRNR